MPIRYKVVKRKTRTSALVNGNSTYALKYLSGTKVFARPETLGIMTFENKRYAEGWSRRMDCCYIKSLMVIKVETIGRGKIPQLICDNFSASALKRFYKKYDDFRTLYPPDGTTCYPGVRVLE